MGGQVSPLSQAPMQVMLARLINPCALLVRIYGFFDFQIVLDGPNMVQMVPNFLNPFYIFCYISVPKIGFQDPS